MQALKTFVLKEMCCGFSASLLLHANCWKVDSDAFGSCDNLEYLNSITNCVASIGEPVVLCRLCMEINF